MRDFLNALRLETLTQHREVGAGSRQQSLGARVTNSAGGSSIPHVPMI